MLRIGITGGIGAGKTTVSRIFQALGVPVYDADSRARWVMEHDSDLRQALQQAFGSDTYVGGQLDRPRLAQLVFNQPERLAQLNDLVHPQVGYDFARWAAVQERAGHPYVLKEAALLYESGSYRQLDYLLVVVAPLAVRQARLQRRDPHRSPAEVQAIIAKQWSDVQKTDRADFVLTNDDQQPVLPQVLALHNWLAGGAAGAKPEKN